MKKLISLLVAFLVLACTSLVLADSVGPTYTLMNENTQDEGVKVQPIPMVKVVKVKKTRVTSKHYRYHKRRHHIRRHSKGYYKRIIRILDRKIQSDYTEIAVLKARRMRFKNMLNSTYRQKKLSKINARMTNSRIPVGGHITYRYQITETPLKQKDKIENSGSLHISPLDKWIDRIFPVNDPLLLPKSIGLGLTVCFVPMFTIFYVIWGNILPLKKIFGSPKPKRPALAS